MFIVRIFGVKNDKTTISYYLARDSDDDLFYLSLFIGNAAKFNTKNKAMLALNKNRENIKSWFDAKEAEKRGEIFKYEILEVTYTTKDEGLL